MMDAITPWDEIVAMIEPYYCKNHLGQQARGIEVMFRRCLLAPWFNLSDKAVGDTIYDSYAMRKFMGLDFTTESVPDATALCKFRKRINDNGLCERYFAARGEFLEAHGRMMHGGAIVDATIIDAPSSTKNAGGKGIFGFRKSRYRGLAKLKTRAPRSVFPEFSMGEECPHNSRQSNERHAKE